MVRLKRRQQFNFKVHEVVWNKQDCQHYLDSPEDDQRITDQNIEL